MRVIVAGSRSIGGNRPDIEAVERAMLDSPFEIDELVHGGARGVDSIAANLFATVNGTDDVTEFAADWDEYGKSAGPIRNQEMAEYADALIAIWDGESTGTRDMIENALDEGLDMYVKVVSDE